MHENQAFPRYLTAAALLDFYGDLAWIPAAILKTRMPALLERVGLADRAREPIARFSKGMVQRLALAQALLAEPDLLVLDEPLEGLDLGGRALLQEVIAQQRRAGKTVLVVSHALGEVAQVCDGRPCWSRDGLPILVRSLHCCAIRTPAESGRSPPPWDRSIDPEESTS